MLDFLNGDLRQESRSKLVFFALLLPILLNSACTKNRAEYIAQGQGKNLVSMVNSPKIFYLKTEAEVPGSKVTLANNSVAKNSLVEANNYGRGNFKIVDFVTDEPLLSRYIKYTLKDRKTNKKIDRHYDFNFSGKPDHKYNLRYKFTEKNLLVQVLATKQEIPESHLRSAELISGVESKNYKETVNNVYAQTILGCPVSYVKIENRLNRNHEKTKELQEYSVRRPEEATHYSVDEASCRKFGFASNEDLFPAELLTGEWYLAETIVKTDAKWESLIGWELATDEKSKKAHRIKFIKYKGYIYASNDNIDEAVKEKDINRKPIVAIPVVDWLDFRVNPESELDEVANEARHWESRDFVRLDFRGMNSRTLPPTLSGATVVSVELGVDESGIGEDKPDYFAVTVQKTLPEQQGQPALRVKYAFVRKEDGKRLPYTPRQYFSEDQSRFGYFYAQQEYSKSNPKNTMAGAADKRRFLTRFNPAKKELIFRFSESTPKDKNIRGAAQKALSAWQKAFYTAGLDTKLILDESRDVSLGDLRYNIINIVESTMVTGLLGVGPSIWDPSTGEIISATANIQLTSIRKISIDFLRNYIRSRLGFFDKKYLCIDETNYNGTLSSEESVDSKKCHKFEDFNKLRIEKLAAFEKDCKSVETFIKNISSDKAYVAALVDGSKLIDHDAEYEAIYNCSEQFSQEMLVSSLIHEIGHNFGLRHNFKGSVDEAHFWPKELTGNVEERTSSVMDYLSPFAQEPQMPGQYDIAAVVFGYKEGLLKENAFTKEGQLIPGSIKSIDPKKSIVDNLKEKELASAKVDTFKYCTDEDVDPTLQQDPMCMRFDEGVTPLEIVNNLIQRYENYYVSRKFRYDKEVVPHGALGAANVVGDIYGILQRFYSRWRFQVFDEYQVRDKYFEIYNSIDDFARDEANWKKQSMAGEFGSDGYYFAAKRVFDFYRQIYLLPDRQCLVFKEGKPRSVNLAGIRKALRGKQMRATTYGQEIVSSCLSGPVQKYLAESGYDFVNGRDGEAYHFDEVGYDLKDASYNINQNPDLTTEEAQSHLDVTGLNWELNFVLNQAMIRRNMNSRYNRHSEFYPHMLDNQLNRRKFFLDTIDRKIHGTLIQIQTLNGKNTAKVLSSFPDGFSPDDEIPQDFMLISDLDENRSHAYAELEKLLFGAWKIIYLDRYSSQAQSRDSLMKMRDAQIFGTSQGDRRLKDAVAVTQPLVNPNTVFATFSDQAYFAKELIEGHEKIRLKLVEIIKKGKAEGGLSKEDADIERLLNGKISILEAIIAALARPLPAQSNPSSIRATTAVPNTPTNSGR